MEEAVVEGGTATACLFHDLLELGLVAKGVGAEWCVVELVCDLDGFVEVGDGEDGEEGAERFAGDHAVVHVADLNDGGLDEEVGFVHCAAEDNLAVAVVNHLLHALELALVDYATVVG